MKNRRYIISGGGTGGHIFPALSIAGTLRERDPSCEILFVGAQGKMEMEKVPAAGYRIVGLPVAGFHRGEILRNLTFLPKLLSSMWQARKVVKSFRPDCVIGVGGYASGPVLRVAIALGIPTLIQEQNSYAGVTNKILGKSAGRICVAYPNMERFFPASKIVFTGNPIRKGLLSGTVNREEALRHFSLDPKRPVILVVGGSLGARTLNRALLKHLDLIRQMGVQWLWQTGKYYYTEVSGKVGTESDPVHVMEFIDRMEYAYSVADVIISRAGAGTISELCVVGKPVILVPSPNVSEDHQTFNARALADVGAALMISDAEAEEKLVETAIGLVADKQRMEQLSATIIRLATPDAAEDIVNEIEKLVR